MGLTRALGPSEPKRVEAMVPFGLCCCHHGGMGVTIAEWFGYRVEDASADAAEAAAAKWCPFIHGPCEKVFRDGLVAGVCSLKPAQSGPVVCCPNRLYGDEWRILRDVVNIAFAAESECASAGQLELVEGRTAQSQAILRGETVVGVFGKKWGGELHLPKRGGSGAYFVDWILALVTPTGLQKFVAVEVQTIDTTGNYRGSIAAMLDGRQVTSSGAGFNWENVSKRILPQVIYKGNVLQREQRCEGGLFFVTPRPVYEKIVSRLIGNDGGLPEYPLSPGAVTFLSYDPADDLQQDGAPTGLRQTARLTSNVVQVAQAFIGVRNLPPMGAYEDAIYAALT